MIQRYENVLSWGQVALSTSAVQIFDGSTAARTASQYGQGLQLTNNDTAVTVYVGYDNTVSSNKYAKELSPGEYFEVLAGKGAQSKIYAVAASGTPSLSVAVLG